MSTGINRLHLMFNGLGSGNIGDEAMFLAFLEHYSLPAGSTVEVFDPSSPVIKTLPRQYRYVDWKDDLNNNQSVKSSRAVLLVGNTPVMSEWGLDWPMKALSSRLCFCHTEGIPVHAVGVGVDYLYDKEAREIFRSAFMPIASWTVRSSSCRSALLDFGVPSEKIVVGADLAWLFSPNVADRQWAFDFWKSIGVVVSKPLLGVNAVNERWSGPTYVKKAIADALDRIIRETGIQAAFLCNETREGKYFDACAAREVIGVMKEDAVLVPNEYFTPSQMVALLSCCTVTLSQRYHFTIFSILADTVPISFARGQKMASLLEELEEEPVGTMEACNPKHLEEQIRYVLSNRSDVIIRQQAAARCLKERAKDNITFINAMLPDFTSSPKLASVSELNSDRFREFMEMLNSRARSWGLKTFTDWSKVWEYPWLWFNGLRSLDWARIKVLDIGSELSPMPWFLASLGSTVTLVERNPQWVPTWERLVNETGYKIDWCIVEDERLPFPTQSFDVVTSFSVVEHQQNKHLAINEVARVLKPEGIFANSFDICEPDMGMTFPEWNGTALTMKEFEELVWKNPAFKTGGKKLDWNIGDCAEFLTWHQESAPHHKYAVGAAIIQKKAGEYVKPDKINIKMCRNILVPRFDTFGDIVLLQGFIKGLLDLLPEARITLLVREGYDQLSALFPERLIWKTTRIHPYKKPSDIDEIKSLLAGLKEDSYDLLLTTTYNHTWPDDLLAATLTSSWRVALGGKEWVMSDYVSEILKDLGIELPENLYDEWVQVEERIHETEKYQTLWKNITGKVDPIPRPQLEVPDNETKKAQEFLATAGLRKDGFVFCFPAGVSSISLKTWPADNFADVIAYLEKTYSIKTLVAAHESEKGIVDKVVDLARQREASPIVWLGKDGDIPLACALIAKSSLYFGNDTGPMHMAAAIGIPVIAIFGGGTWPRFLPCTDHGAVFTQELPCFYCMWEGDFCWLADAPCIKTVLVKHVIAAIDSSLNGMINRLEVHKGLSLDTYLNMFLEKGYKNSKEFLQKLSELREVYHQAVEEIRKRDVWLSELREVYHQAVGEIGKRDDWLSELRRSNDDLTRINKQALRVLPLVSIITPVFNGAKWIDNCIQSVLNQNYPKIEHIIVDGGSTDGTIKICNKYAHLVIHSKKDRGQSHAINKGFAMAQGEILAWLCADDEYEPGAIQAAVKGIIAGYDVVMGYSRFIDAEGNVIGDHPANIYDNFDHAMFLRFWKYGTISQPATFWTRKMWETCGPAKENQFFAMDYDLWLRMSQKTVFQRIFSYVAKYRIHPDAKCFYDNYGSRIELINVSKNFWPAKWKIGYWKLFFQYLFSYGAITQHYADAEKLLNATLENLNHHRLKAIFNFILAHLKHFSTPRMPGYKTILKRVLGEGIGPLWFWRFAKRVYYRLTLRKKVSLSVNKNISESGITIVFHTEIIGYRKPQFKYWAKSGDEFIVLRDWSPESSYVLADKFKGVSDVGVHVRSGDKGHWQNQAWVVNEGSERT